MSTTELQIAKDNTVLIETPTGLVTTVNHANIDLMSAIAKAKQSIGASGFSSDQYVKIAFLSEGIHKIRFFYDPVGDIFRSVCLHQVNRKKTHCPDYLKKQFPLVNKHLPKCEICEIAEKVDNWRAYLGRRHSSLIYGHIYDTNSPTEYWKANTTGIIIGKTRMRDSIITCLEGLVTDAGDFVRTMLNPNVSGGMVTVKFTGGKQPQVDISAIPGSLKDKIELGSWYKPLTECWVSKDFDEASYLECLEEAKIKALEYEGIPNADDDQVTDTDTDSSTEPTQQGTSETFDLKNSLADGEAPKVSKNMVSTKSGLAIELPPEVVKLGCWTLFDQQKPECMVCKVQMQCLFEQSTMPPKK